LCRGIWVERVVGSQALGTSTDEAKRAIEEADTNGDGKVNYAEYVCAHRLRRGAGTQLQLQLLLC